MMYDSLLSRSFSKQEKKKLGYGGLIIAFLLAFSFATVLNPYLGPLPVSALERRECLKAHNPIFGHDAVNLRLSIGAGRMLEILNDRSGSLLLLPQQNAVKNTQLVSNDASKLVFNKTGINENETTVEKSTTQKTTKVGVEVAETVKKETAFVNITNGNHMVAGEIVRNNQTKAPLCFETDRSDVCEMEGDIRIDPNTSTIFVVSPQNGNISVWKIRPYARKGDKAAMNNTKEWSVELVPNDQNIPKCTHSYNVSAILFSLGGYSGNHFHAFTDIILPLFSTARPFNGAVQFLVTDRQRWWITKFQVIIKSLSKYDIVEIDNIQNVHCFASLTVGLKRESKKELTIDSSKFGYSIKDFRQFLASSYSLRKKNAIKMKKGNNITRPKLLIISRKKSRAFTNVREITRMARTLGFKVVVDEPNANLSRSSQIMNSCDVVLGVHGAGLTNMLFLPENAILIQVVPFGGAEWVSKTFFEVPAMGMNIRYLEYKIGLEESSLINQFPADHVVLKNPSLIKQQGWAAFKSIYFDKQNVKLDLSRFKLTLLKALELLHQ